MVVSGFDLLGSRVKSVQRGTYRLESVEGTFDISEVDATNTLCKISADKRYNSAKSNEVAIELIGSSTVKVSRNDAEDFIDVSWEVVEFSPLKSKQTGVKAGVGKIPISEVNPNKSIVFSSGVTSGNSPSEATTLIRLLGSNELQLLGSANTSTYWQVLEFS